MNFFGLGSASTPSHHIDMNPRTGNIASGAEALFLAGLYGGAEALPFRAARF